MDKGKAVSTHGQSNENSSSGDDGLIRRGRREWLNMPKFPVASTKDQVAGDRELAKKLVEEERTRPSGPVEMPGNEEFAFRL